MYYKDTYIEIRIGLGIKAFKKASNAVVNLILAKEVNKYVYENIQSFSSEVALTTYPSDGNYRLSVSAPGQPIYFVYFTINDFFIKEFVNQIIETACKCKCGDTTLPCHESKANAFAIKRQKMFNLMTILPYTSKPISYGQSATSNMYLSKFFQSYINATLDERLNELKEEYFDYFTKGNTDSNVKLFNNLIGMYYYGLYYYSKKLLLIGANSNYNNYFNTINDFFKKDFVTSCLKCDVNSKDLEILMDDVFANPCDCADNESENGPVIPIGTTNSFNQDNFSRVITVTDGNLSGEGTLEEQIAEYVNTLNYNKSEVDADVWVEYDSEAVTPQPIDCVVGDWGNWSICSINGIQTRTREIITSPTNGGVACPVLSETRNCNYVPPIIPIDATVSPWTDYSVCSVDGFQTRTRYIITPASGGGTTPVLSETVACVPEVVEPTPTNAIVSEWGEWSLCSIEGFTTRTRTVSTPATNGGTTPILTETVSCVYAGRTQIGQYFSDPCGSIISDIWFDPNSNLYYTTEFGSTLIASLYLYDPVGYTGPGLDEYEWSYFYIENGITNGEYYRTFSSCTPNYGGGGGGGTTFNLASAPSGGCSVTYSTPQGGMATLNVPPQDEGLSFTIEVGSGGIQSDSCGFV